MRSVISVEVHLLYLAHERITRICACTLVIKRLLRHFVNACKKFLFVNAVILNCFLYSDLFLKFIYGFYEIFKLIAVGFALYSEVIGNLGISCQRVRLRILRECTHFNGSFHCIETEHLVNHESIRNAVRQMEECAELVSH